MDTLPFEVLLQIFEYLPFSSYQPLYSIFPQALIDEAIVYKLRNKKNAVVDLISTNLHELSANILNQRNESSLSLFFTSFDSSHRFIWTLPDFNHSHHYFRVKDAYVSHGKLVLRKPHDVMIPNFNQQQQYQQQKFLSSLWEIRKSFPPTRAGSFSGASEYSRIIKSQELTIHQSGCILDSCLIPSGGVTNNNANGNTIVKVVSRGGGEEAVGTGVSNEKVNNDDTDEEEEGLKRPELPLNYHRQVPINTSSWSPSTYPDPTCGYFLVERLAISIPAFLELYSTS